MPVFMSVIVIAAETCLSAQAAPTRHQTSQLCFSHTVSDLCAYEGIQSHVTFFKSTMLQGKFVAYFMASVAFILLHARLTEMLTKALLLFLFFFISSHDGDATKVKCRTPL